MYSRSQTGRTERIRLPDHYSGVAFDRAHPDAPPALAPPLPPTREIEYCADGLPEATGARPPDAHTSKDSAHITLPAENEKNPPPANRSAGEGLLGAIGGEELLLLGIIFLLSQKQGEDDTILLLLLLLLRR